MPLEASSYSLKGSILNIFFSEQWVLNTDIALMISMRVLPTCNTLQKLLSVAHCAEKKIQQKP